MNEEKVLLNATLCLLLKDDQVLLGLKTKKIGAGFWNGYGGGIEDGESIEEAAIRELEEETGKKIGDIFITTTKKDLEKVAIVDFENIKSDGVSFVCKVHFFLVRKWSGKAINTDEMTNPTFFDIKDIPIDEMLPADRYFIPLILDNKKIIGKIKYGPYQKELLEPALISEVSSFNEN